MAAAAAARRKSVQRVSWTHLHSAVDPGQNSSHSGVNSRLVGLGAARTPAGDARQVPAVLTLTHQGAATVALRDAMHTLEVCY